MNPANLHTFRLLILLLLLAGCIQRSDVRGPAIDQDLHKDSFQKQDKEEIKQVPEEAIPSRFEEFSAAGQKVSEPSPDLTAPGAEYYIPVREPAKTSPIRSKLESLGDPGTSSSPGFKTTDFDANDFFRNGRIANGVYLTIIIDNDIFDYTDYYYTSGLSIELFHPAISASPLSHLLPGIKGSVNYYSISLTQNMYTPRELEIDSVLTGDRPFASYLTLSHNKYSLNPSKRTRLESRIDIGVIGPNSLGQAAQDVIHTNEPVGWVNQVANDFVLNYAIRYEKGFFRERNFEMAFFGGGQVGTLYDNMTGGLFLQIGKINGRYESLFQTTPRQPDFLRRIRYYVNLNLENKLVIYDATLQGGMFNPNSVYTLPDDMIQRYVFTGKLGFGFGLGPLSLEAEQVFLSPEFDGGRHHFWFRIKSTVHIN